MKLRTLALCSGLSLSLLYPAVLVGDQPATAAGYWEGAISLLNQDLDVSVELELASESAWQGKISIPVQGVQGFTLDPVKVDGTAVEFAMPGIPGEPKFTGTLAADAKSISGEFAQGGRSFPFRLERKPKPATAAREVVPERGVPGTGLAGNWRGALTPMPNIELRLALELAADEAGQVGGVLISLDQGHARIPIIDLTETDGRVQFKTPSVNGEYTGQLGADGAEIAGDWTQNGRSTRLTFKRLPAPPKS